MRSELYSIDHGGHRAVRLDLVADGARLALVAADGDTRSPYHRALVRHLAVAGAGQRWSLDATTESVIVPRSVEAFDVVVGPLIVLELRPPGPPSMRAVLTPFEVRFLADHGVPPSPLHLGAGRGAPLAELTTDLHTHFAGCVDGEGLVEIGLDAGVSYPSSLLGEAGIRIDHDRDVRLDQLGERVHARLAASLCVAHDRRVTFVEMERIYRLRAPITKHPAAFLPLCRRLAHDYAKMGVKYVELSLSNVVEAARLEVIHRELPAVEADSGVTMRFLAALSRHDDLEWDLDLLDRFREIARSRYFVGVDFMGHETNSTRAFSAQLREIAAWAHDDRPGFVVRVHAGENPAFPENVRVAAECVAGRDVQLRVGHGLYGVDARTEDLLRAASAIVELNLDSNLALNNIQSAAEVPLRRYLDAGLPVVLGTDGYGIYQTTLEQVAQAAQIAGLEAADLAQIAATEARYVAERARRDELATVSPASFRVPPDSPGRHYTPDVPRRNERERARRRQTLVDCLQQLSVPLLSRDELDRWLSGKQVISIAGAWRESWEAVSAAGRDSVRRELGALFDGLAPAETIIVTGGTTWGVENEAQRAARARGLTVLAALVAETPPGSISGDIGRAWLAGTNLHEKAAGLYELMRSVDGLCLFLGGGGIVADEIQTASNLRLRYLVMDGPEGASTRHAARQPSRAFRTGADVLARLAVRRWPVTTDPYWHPGPNPTVDVVVLRASPASGEDEVLLVRRDESASSEGGKWALPGSFQLTDAPRGVAWAPGRESHRQAAIRLLRRETGLDISDLAGRLNAIGDYQGEGRDPRDTPEAWSRSIALGMRLPQARAAGALAAGHDTRDARWWPARALPCPLAFDHARIVDDALARLGIGAGA